MEFNRCLGCMEEKHQHPICEHCGYDERTRNQIHQLPAGTILRGQYLIGRVLGQGGFGITYLAWDLNLDMPVAIKEYFPTGLVTRDVSTNTGVTSYEGDDSLSYEESKKRFLREGKALAKFNDLNNIVRIYSLFPENNTAYLVMEYLKGRTLQQYLDTQGALSFPQAVALLAPLMEDLQTIHESGIIHRDISPDNIMVMPDGSARLLDFGTVRQVENFDQNAALSKSTEAILKQGFAPIEQYNSRGSLGPWTDVYALCATICYCLNRKIPQIAPDRVYADAPEQFINILPIGEPQKKVLRNGMALRPQERTKDVSQLLRQLRASLPPAERKPAPASPKAPGRKPKKAIWLILPMAGILALALCLTLLQSPEKPQTAVPETVEVSEQTEIAPAAVLPETTPSAEPETSAAASLSETTPAGWAPAEDRLLKRPDDSGLAFESTVAKSSVTSIEFQDTLENAPSHTVDVSQSGNGKVLLWLTESQGGGNKLVIAAEGKVIFPENCSRLFGAPKSNSGSGFQILRTVAFHNAVDTSRVKDMSGLFYNSENLKDVDLSGLDTSHVTNMEDMFSGCQRLFSLTLSGISTVKVTKMSRMFENCRALTSLDLSSFDTSQVRDMENMFYGCIRLTTLDVSSFDVGRVVNMNGMFNFCTDLTYLDLTSFDTKNVLYMNHIFSNCNARLYIETNDSRLKHQLGA